MCLRYDDYWIDEDDNEEVESFDFELTDIIGPAVQEQMEQAPALVEA